MGDDGLDELYGVKPEDFTALRSRLAAEAKGRGDVGASKAISASRKPTTAAWVVNRLALEDRQAKRRLADLGERLRAAHAAMDGHHIRELSAQQRTLIHDLARSAFERAELKDPPAALRDDVTDTLQAAIADPDIADRLGRLAKAQRYSRQLAILFIDLDGFKQINDRFGHDAGDHLLVTFTLRLRESLRKSDLVGRHTGSDTAARLGGDEFVVLIDEFVDPLELQAVAERVLAAAAQPFPLAGPEGEVSASIGISVYPIDGTDIESLTKSADSAMYRAKRAGKNTYRFFSGVMDHHSRAEVR